MTDEMDALHNNLPNDQAERDKTSGVRFNEEVQVNDQVETQQLHTDRFSAQSTEQSPAVIEDQTQPPSTTVTPVSAYKSGNVRSNDNIDQHSQVLKEDKQALDRDWRDEVNIDKQNEDERQRLNEILAAFQHMWDGRLGNINITQHRIDLKPDTKPVFQPPYRAGPRQRELEQMEIQRMLEQDVIEPSMSEWAAPIVFAPKKDGS